MTLENDTVLPDANGVLSSQLTPAPQFQQVARFSPGPWWGWNGVVTLGVSQSSLYIFRNRFLRKPYLLETIPLQQVASASVRDISRWGRSAIRAEISLREGRHLKYSSKFRQARELVKLLASHT